MHVKGLFVITISAIAFMSYAGIFSSPHTGEGTNQTTETKTMLQLSTNGVDDALKTNEKTVLDKQYSALQKQQEELVNAQAMIRNQLSKVDSLWNKLQSKEDEQVSVDGIDVNLNPDADYQQQENFAQEDIFAQEETQLFAETVDPDWSAGAESSLGEAVFTAIESEDSNLVSTSCRSSLCRLEVDHADRSSADQFMEKLPEQIEWDHEGLVKYEEQSDGSIKVVMLVTRQGHPLQPGAE